MYRKFLETGSIRDRVRVGRPSTITEDKVQEIQQILDGELFEVWHQRQRIFPDIKHIK